YFILSNDEYESPCGCFYGSIAIELYPADFSPDNWEDVSELVETVKAIRPKDLVTWVNGGWMTPLENYLVGIYEDGYAPTELIEALAAYVEQRKESSSE